MFFFICAWMNGWVNNGEAGDLRRHGAHYDVAVMSITGGRLNKKDGLTRYGNSHVKDKTS